MGTSQPALIIPSVANSPHRDALRQSLAQQLPHSLYFVSEDLGGDPGVRVAPTAGFAERANSGIRAALSEGATSLVLANDDTAFEPDALAALLRLLEEDGVGVVGARILEWDGRAVQQLGIAVNKTTGRIRVLEQPPRRLQAVSGAAMAIRPECWKELSGFDERYHFYFEDVDFCLRAAARGWDVRRADDARVRHYGGGTRPSSSTEAAFHLGRSHSQFVASLTGNRLAKAWRLINSWSAGVAWSLKGSGPSGLTAFSRGWAEGTRRLERKPITPSER